MSEYNESSENAPEQQPQDQKKKLSDQQLRIIQVVLGIVSAALLMVTLYMPNFIVLTEKNSLLQYTFLVVFLIIMFGRRTIENKYRLRLGLYGLVLIDGILAGILLFLLFESRIQMDATLKLAILIGGTVLLLAFGIGWPLMRYFERKEKGTLPPIRLPEQQESKEDAPKEEGGPLTTEQKIAEMMRELDGDKDNSEE